MTLPSNIFPRAQDPGRVSGFTLLELLVAIAIFALIGSVTFALMASVSKAWERGTALSEDLHAGDYVIDQVIDGLLSARYRDKTDGLHLEDKGNGPGAMDSISWVKEGPALVGEDSNLAKTYHRIRFFIGKDKHGKPGATYTAWGDEYLQPDDFDPDSLTPELLSDRVVGFNCRVATNNFEMSQLHWLDKWDEDIAGDNQSNHVPRFIEITLYLKPLSEGDPPLEMRRMADIPMASKGMK
jgi:prepilin-type N-terminal cleavage/methylation domain-containing protein